MIIKPLSIALIVATAITIINIASNFSFAQEVQKFAAVLTPEEVVPPVYSPATGSVEFTVSGDTIRYSINVSGIIDPTTAHIHIGAKGTNGLDLATLFENPAVSANNKVTEGGELTKESGLFEYVTDLTTPMADGDLYVDVHTTQNPEGELRGQIAEEK